MRLFKRLESRGDTIVEVLIAMAVISLVLAGAYVTTQKSVIATRDAQEHSEGLKLLEGQIESIRNFATLADGSAPFTPPSNNFCISPADGTTVHQTASTGATLPSLDSDTYTSAYYAQGCTNVGPGNLYNIIVQYDSSTSTYSLTNRWDRIGGGKDQVNLVYRIY